ncbi:hypothetical protein ACF3N7_09990 [Cruoricaptor ignavus]|uniref:hypothetical protein n=1 Tax=Cruoricaptor ignavus TaxID=1118202 RepID=UPI00370D0435
MSKSGNLYNPGCAIAIVIIFLIGFGIIFMPSGIISLPIYLIVRKSFPPQKSLLLHISIIPAISCAAYYFRNISDSSEDSQSLYFKFALVGLACYIVMYALMKNRQKEIEDEQARLAEEERIRMQMEQEAENKKKMQQELKRAEKYRIKKEKAEAERQLIVKTEKENILNVFGDESKNLLLPKNIYSHKLSKSNDEIIKRDRDKARDFVKLSSFIKRHRESLINLYKSVATLDSPQEILNVGSVLESQLKIQHQMQFHALNMLSAFLSDNLIAFYEIYEEFEKFGVFNLNWQNELISQTHSLQANLSKIEARMDSLDDSLQELVSENYLTQNSVDELRQSIERS